MNSSFYAGFGPGRNPNQRSTPCSSWPGRAMTLGSPVCTGPLARTSQLHTWPQLPGGPAAGMPGSRDLLRRGGGGGEGKGSSGIRRYTTALQCHLAPAQRMERAWTPLAAPRRHCVVGRPADRFNPPILVRGRTKTI